MKPSILTKNVVVTGLFNPDIFDRLFFVDNKIVPNKSEILENSIFQNGQTLLVTNDFQVSVSFNQLLIYTADFQKNVKINDILKSILDSADIKTIVNLGINIDWLFPFENVDELRKTSRRFFYNENEKLLPAFFGGDDSQFGFYVSKKLDLGKLKLTIRPVKHTDLKTNANTDALLYQFNFHFDNASKELATILSKYGEYVSMSEKIMELYK